ncbi:MAG TPA: hypothetical protein PK156_41270 [Polyangium sp.]|nr:hypothetical protein [Polyangium sp.]
MRPRKTQARGGFGGTLPVAGAMHCMEKDGAGVVDVLNEKTDLDLEVAALEDGLGEAAGSEATVLDVVGLGAWFVGPEPGAEQLPKKMPAQAPSKPRRSIMARMMARNSRWGKELAQVCWEGRTFPWVMRTLSR